MSRPKSKEGDILFVKTGSTIGKAAIVDKLIANIINLNWFLKTIKLTVSS